MPTKYYLYTIETTLIEHFDNSLFSIFLTHQFYLPEPRNSQKKIICSGNGRRKGIPSIAFVDSWVSYWQRFTPNKMVRNKFSDSPGFIAVIDHLMYDRMVEYGCDKKLLIITGSPAFDNLQNYVPHDRKHIEFKYGEEYVLFIGEPFNDVLFERNEKDTLGYTEAEVLELTVNALEMLEKQNLKLVYRPHRRGCSTELTSIIENHSNVIVDNGAFDPRDLATCANAVVGMTSMFLFEASIMDVPAISIQPSRILSSDLLDHSNNIPVVINSRVDEIAIEMKKILTVKPEFRNTAKSTLCDQVGFIISKQ